jgi:flavin-binding protein dodecin
MSVIKVIEVLAQSNRSWEDAAQQALKEVGQSVRNVKSIYIKDLQATVDNNQITSYRINAKVSFEVDKQAQGAQNAEREMAGATAASARGPKTENL